MSRIVAHTDRQAVGYLLEEFLAQQAQPVQEFLLQTSILERFSAPLCAAVTAGPHTQAADTYLLQLSQSNPLLFELDDRRQWYRYHPLLQDFLRSTLTRRLAPEEIGALHRRASDWYAGSGMIDDAAEHALAAGDLQIATQLIEGSVQPAIEQVQVTILERRLRLLPPEVLSSNPALLIGQAFIAQVRDEIQRMPALLEAAEAGLERADWRPGDELRLFVSSVIHVGWSLFYHFTSQNQRSLQHAELSLKLTPWTHQWSAPQPCTKRDEPTRL